MKDLRWFGYKIKESEAVDIITKALIPHEIYVQKAQFRLYGYYSAKRNSLGDVVLLGKSTHRTCLLSVLTTLEGYRKLCSSITNYSDSLIHETKTADNFNGFYYSLTFETANDLNSIENFLRENNAT